MDFKVSSKVFYVFIKIFVFNTLSVFVLVLYLIFYKPLSFLLILTLLALGGGGGGGGGGGL